MDVINLTLGILLVLQLAFMRDGLPAWWQFFMALMAALNIAIVFI